MKKLDAFEMECILKYFGSGCATDCSQLGFDDADAKRLRSRVRRFVLTHPDVTPKLRRVFNKEMRDPR